MKSSCNQRGLVNTSYLYHVVSRKGKKDEELRKLRDLPMKLRSAPMMFAKKLEEGDARNPYGRFQMLMYEYDCILNLLRLPLSF